jgi:hypothetical protein
MSYNEDMTIDERRKYLSTMKKRYIEANRKDDCWMRWRRSPAWIARP